MLFNIAFNCSVQCFTEKWLIDLAILIKGKSKEASILCIFIMYTPKWLSSVTVKLICLFASDPQTWKYPSPGFPLIIKFHIFTSDPQKLLISVEIMTHRHLVKVFSHSLCVYWVAFDIKTCSELDATQIQSDSSQLKRSSTGNNL